MLRSRASGIAFLQNKGKSCSGVDQGPKYNKERNAYDVTCTDSKRLVLKLVFTRPLEYRRNEGFQTAATALPFELSGQFADSKSAMVEDSGISTRIPNLYIARYAQSMVNKMFHLKVARTT
jgi:hypothetical protein